MPTEPFVIVLDGVPVQQWYYRAEIKSPPNSLSELAQEAMPTEAQVEELRARADHRVIDELTRHVRFIDAADALEAAIADVELTALRYFRWRLLVVLRRTVNHRAVVSD